MFISIDETSFNRNNTSIYGYAPKGNKVFIRKSIPSKTSICCISNDKIIYNKVLEGSVNAKTFLEFLKQLNLSNNHVLLLDNASIHHSKLIKEYCLLRNIELLYNHPIHHGKGAVQGFSPARKAQLLRAGAPKPSHSVGRFNPIELAFSIVKRHYYKNYSIQNAFDTLTKDHLNSFFNKCLNTITKF